MTAVSDAASGADFDDAAAAQLDLTEQGDRETDVLIIGSGPAGGAAALALATLGVEHLVKVAELSVPVDVDTEGCPRPAWHYPAG